jgi:hypothetical protein
MSEIIHLKMNIFMKTILRWWLSLVLCTIFCGYFKASPSIETINARYRNALFDSYVFPIGDRPSNASFTGFQFVNNNNHSGHLLLFRELYSGEVEKEIRLAFLKNKTLKLINLRNQTETILHVNADGFAKFNIENPADFGFYRYEIKK